MTTNKPEVVAWIKETWRSATESRPVVHDWEGNGSVVSPLVRLSDYEALQAEFVIRLDELSARNYELRMGLAEKTSECEKLRKDAERYRWLEPHLYVLQVCTPEGRVFEICIDGAEVPAIGSLRQAIDAAMQEPSHDNQ